MKPSEKIVELRKILLCCVVAAITLTACGKKEDSIAQAEPAGPAHPGIEEVKSIMEEAYIYGFPMIAAYKAMYQFNVDKSSSQYKAGFNQIWNDSKTFTPADTAIVTPNADTPYSMIQADLRAEPIVFCVPEVEQGRYFSVQLADLYSFNYGYVGSRATGNVAGCYLLAGPGWEGEAPAGIAKVFHSETDFSLMIYRTQLFNQADIDNVIKIQKGYTVQPLSAFLNEPAPPAAPTINFPPFTGDDPFKSEFASYLDFLLQFAPEVSAEKALRARFASVGIGPGKTFDFKDLSLEHKAAAVLAIKEAAKKIGDKRNRPPFYRPVKARGARQALCGQNSEKAQTKRGFAKGLKALYCGQPSGIWNSGASTALAFVVSAWRIALTGWYSGSFTKSRTACSEGNRMTTTPFSGLPCSGSASKDATTTFPSYLVMKGMT